MDIQTLREFLLLSKTLNYRVAAESLFITQPTLSKHIKALEAELDCELFSRTTKEVAITENGRIFREYAERIVNEYDMAYEILSGKHRVRGTLRIAGAIRFPIINNIISTATGVFEAKYPDVTIIVEDIQWEDFRHRLLNNTFDIVFTAHFPGLNDEGIVTYDICDTPLCAWVNKDNPLAQQDSVSLEELSKLSMRILNPQKSETFSSYVRDIFFKRGFNIKIGKPLSQVFVIDNNGFAFTPKFSPENSFGHNLRAIDIVEPESLPISCFRKRNISNPLAVLFFEEFRTIAATWDDAYKQELSISADS